MHDAVPHTSMNLKQKTIRALFWLSSAKLLCQVFSSLMTIFVVRFLEPLDFGLIAMASLFIGFLDLLAPLGIGAAIIRQKSLDDVNLHACFWLSILLGFFFYIFTFLLAPTIASFFVNDRLILVVRTLELIFPIGAFRLVPFNLLTRELAFAKRSTAEFLSVSAGGILSLTLAIRGHGVWSLVLGTLLRETLLTLLI